MQIVGEPLRLMAVHRNTDLQVRRVPVQTGQRNWRVIFSELVEDIMLGEVLYCTAEVELTNDIGRSCEVVGKLVLGDDRDDVEGSSGAILISGGGGENLTPEIHHRRSRRDALWVNDRQYFGARRVNFCVRTVTGAAVPAGSELSIEPNGCGLTVFRYRRA